MNMSLQIPKEIMDSPWREPYPPMIKLDIEPSNSGAVSSSHIYVDVVGVGEKKQFVLYPKVPQGTSVTQAVCGKVITITPSSRVVTQLQEQ